MSILIVDDEERDVDDLMSILQAGPGARMSIDYCSESNDAIPLMIGRRKPYRALITDFNMDGFNGKDLLRMVTGNLDAIKGPLTPLQKWSDVKDRHLREYLRDNFGTVANYSLFVERHTDLVKILHSSNTYGDGENDLPNTISFVKKPNASDAILDILVDEGAISEEDARRARSYEHPDD